MTDGIIDALRSLAAPIDSLQSLRGNPHHGDVAALARSWDRFGQRRPITARHIGENGDGEVTAGNHGLEAAKQLGWSHVAVAWVDDDDATAKAWAVADNHTAALGTDDPAALIEFLLSVRSADADLFADTSYDDTDLLALLGATARPNRRSGGGEVAETQDVVSSWSVFVTCADEVNQLELLQRLTDEGYECRALIS